MEAREAERQQALAQFERRERVATLVAILAAGALAFVAAELGPIAALVEGWLR